jgi:hypothetical protein
MNDNNEAQKLRLMLYERFDVPYPELDWEHDQQFRVDDESLVLDRGGVGYVLAIIEDSFDNRQNAAFHAVMAALSAVVASSTEGSEPALRKAVAGARAALAQAEAAGIKVEG